MFEFLLEFAGEFFDGVAQAFAGKFGTMAVDKVARRSEIARSYFSQNLASTSLKDVRVASALRNRPIIATKNPHRS
jgi:hypothetical protein